MSLRIHTCSMHWRPTAAGCFELYVLSSWAPAGGGRVWCIYSTGSLSSNGDLTGSSFLHKRPQLLWSGSCLQPQFLLCPVNHSVPCPFRPEGYKGFFCSVSLSMCTSISFPRPHPYLDNIPFIKALSSHVCSVLYLSWHDPTLAIMSLLANPLLVQ